MKFLISGFFLSLGLAVLVFSSSAHAAHGPGNDPSGPTSPSTPWPPSSPQNNNCGGQECFPTGGGPGPHNGDPFILHTGSNR